MNIQILKSKTHRVAVSEEGLNYIGSLIIDEDLLGASKLVKNENVQILNMHSRLRLETYVIKGIRGSEIIYSLG